MDVFFLRHGEPIGSNDWNGEELTRPLTDEGIEHMRREAGAMVGLSLGITLILSSPLKRAMQTATITAEVLGLSKAVRPEKRLAPGFDITELQAILAGNAKSGTLLLVGHEPDFSRTVSACIGGGHMELKKGGLALVQIALTPEPKGRLLWLLPPQALLRYC
jgi:phosphohistidine phosphatase